MTDDKTKTDKRDRSRVAGGEDYEVQYLAEQTGLSEEQARILIRRYGNDRAKLMEEAKIMRGAR
jgi:glycerol-3-phosphate dehydrogenase